MANAFNLWILLLGAFSLALCGLDFLSVAVVGSPFLEELLVGGLLVDGVEGALRNELFWDLIFVDDFVEPLGASETEAGTTVMYTGR